MSSLILPSRFTQQPQVPTALDRSNPLTKGLVHAYLGYAQYDSAVEKSLTPMTPPKVVPGGVEFSAVNASLYRLATAKEKSNSFTTAVLVRSLGNSSAYAAIAGVTYDNAGNAPYGDQIDRGSDGASLRFAFNVGGNAASTTQFGNLVVGVDEWLVATYTNGFQALYRQSLGLIDSQSGTGAPLYSATSLLNIGPSTNDGRNPNLIVKASLRWDRVLTAAERNAVMWAPWQVAKAPVRRYWVSAPVTGNTISPDTGIIGFAGQFPSLAQSNNKVVTPATGTVSFAGQTPSLSQSNNKSLVGGTPAALVFAGLSPSLSRSSNQSLVSGAPGALSFTGLVPSLAQAAQATLRPSPGSVVFVGQIPALTQSVNRTVSPGITAINFVGLPPSFQTSGPTILAPAPSQVKFQGLVPSLVIDVPPGPPPPLSAGSGSGSGLQALPPVPPLTQEGFAANTWQRWFDILRNRVNGSYSGLDAVPDEMAAGASAAGVFTLAQSLANLEVQIAVLPDSGPALQQLQRLAALLGEDANFANLTASGKFGVNGKPAQAAVALPVAATDAATTMALANALRALLIANGQGS